MFRIPKIYVILLQSLSWPLVFTFFFFSKQFHSPLLGWCFVNISNLLYITHLVPDADWRYVGSFVCPWHVNHEIPTLQRMSMKAVQFVVF